MTPFEKALIQAVNDDFFLVPPEEELDCPTVSLKKIHKTNVLRRCLLAAAVSVLLIGSALATYVVKHAMVQVQIVDLTDKIEVSINTDHVTTHYFIDFPVDFASPDAPDTIETFYLPTIMVSAKSLDRRNTSIGKEGLGGYHPFGIEVNYVDTKQEDYPKIHDAPDRVSYTWNNSLLYDYEYPVIRFSQELARRANNEPPAGINLWYTTSATVVPSQGSIEIDEYSIFTFDVLFTQDGSVDRHWFWTDGDYLFRLNAQDLTLEEMTELFRSVKAVSTKYPYGRTEAPPHRPTENFDLP